MKKIMTIFLLLFSLHVYCAVTQEVCHSVAGGKLCTPKTSLQFASRTHARYSTNYTLFIPNASNTTPIETPPSIACLYGLTPYVPGCQINGTSAVPTGGSGVIGIIDTGFDSTIGTDLNTFSERYGLPSCSGLVSPYTSANPCFQIVYVTPLGGQPAGVTDAGGEQHIDVEWSHAMAPNAKIVLFLGNSDQSLEDMAQRASAWMVTNVGGGILSMSLAGPEFPTELASDASYQTPGIIYIASAGDYGTPARYPSASPYIISVGGTMILRDANGNFSQEVAWNHDGGIGSGGPSLYEQRPSYQNSVQKLVGSARGTPDIAFAAYSLSIYNSNSSSTCFRDNQGWCSANGTSISAPALAGIINAANHGSRSSTEELTYIYASALKQYHSNWHDIVVGRSNLYATLPGYDFCTGLGSPLGYGGK